VHATTNVPFKGAELAMDLLGGTTTTVAKVFTFETVTALNENPLIIFFRVTV
jgi:hypothetical protein